MTDRSNELSPNTLPVDDNWTGSGFNSEMDCPVQIWCRNRWLSRLDSQSGHEDPGVDLGWTRPISSPWMGRWWASSRSLAVSVFGLIILIAVYILKMDEEMFPVIAHWYLYLPVTRYMILSWALCIAFFITFMCVSL